MLRHYINSVSGEYIKTQTLLQKVGYTTSQPFPEIELAENEYFAMLNAGGKVQYWPDDTGCTWQVKTRFEKVIAYHKQTQQPKQFDDKSLVADEYTLIKPSTKYDDWIDSAWVTDISKKYIADYAQVDAIRESLYRTQTDPLENKTRRLERSGTTAQELQVYYDRVDELVAKIKADNPWPVKPEV